MKRNRGTTQSTLNDYINQINAFSKYWNSNTKPSIKNPSYRPPKVGNVYEYFDMGSIEIEIDGEADPEMVMAEVKEIIEERKRRLQERQ